MGALGPTTGGENTRGAAHCAHFATQTQGSVTCSCHGLSYCEERCLLPLHHGCGKGRGLGRGSQAMPRPLPMTSSTGEQKEQESSSALRNLRIGHCTGGKSSPQEKQLPPWEGGCCRKLTIETLGFWAVHVTHSQPPSDAPLIQPGVNQENLQGNAGRCSRRQGEGIGESSPRKAPQHAGPQARRTGLRAAQEAST